ncbi:hypothetical protein L0B53_01650 [Vibrio sp. SS-MA-C1-2]|uniref:hypothetical protein n=1 Tax=Vibrio sp. SS-MA-C1-2 TaxID=2908646 RepID=UPI001F28AB96|nr:hypothetical protein [Vibrio sp. SS-MA-C1-2]UJF17500.1 hypothetical protein L0B53_01650 [Vibrio sp. SS-MA-C1-2]
MANIIRNRIDLTFQRFGLLIAVSTDTYKDQKGWLCHCDCGNLAFARADALIRGRRKSCGCLRRFKRTDKNNQIEYYHRDIFASKNIKQVESLQDLVKLSRKNKLARETK